MRGVQQPGSEFSVLRHHFFNHGCALTQRVKITPVKVKTGDVMSPLSPRLAGSPFSTSFPPPKGISHDRINLPRLEKRRQSLLLLLLHRDFFIVDRRGFRTISFVRYLSFDTTSSSDEDKCQGTGNNVACPGFPWNLRPAPCTRARPYFISVTNGRIVNGGFIDFAEPTCIDSLV